MVVGLGLLSFVAAALGLFMMSNATVGVGIMAGACLLAIFARIVQAAAHQQQILRTLQEAAQRPVSAPPVSISGPWTCQQCEQRNSQQMSTCTRCGTVRSTTF